MKCNEAHERMVAAEYEELAAGEAGALELHMAGCAECAHQREQLRAMKLLADAYPVEEPEANLLARARMRLASALDALPPRRWHDRLAQRFRDGIANLQAAPVAACLLLVMGAGAGTLGGFRIAERRAAKSVVAQTNQTQPAAAPTATASAPEEVASVSSIVRQPNSHIVEVQYKQLVPRTVQGSLDDPAIRQLLMMASRNASTTGVRDDSVGLMASECKAGHECKAEGIRDALLVALRTDRNAAVREKALVGLEPYVAEDVRVRNAVLEALMNDSDPRVRTSAISLLEPVEADTSVRQVLHSVADTDVNPYIRTASRQVLDSVPEIQ